MPIQVDNVCKSYHGQKVLDHLSLSFQDGVSYCIMAPSGYGKTTLLHMIMGLKQPDFGTINGVECVKFAPVFQDDRLCEMLSVGANIRLTRRRNLSRQEMIDCLNALGLESCIAKPVCALSGGMKRRVAIARALLSDGDVLIMDEPFKGLDKECKQQVIEYVRMTVEGKTVLWVTHDEGEYEKMGGELIRL